MIPLCPVCDEPMFIVELRDVEVDYCARCGGVWLDEGELELLSLAGNDDPLVQAHRAAPEADVPGTRGGKPGAKRRCPRCSRPLEPITMGSDPQVRLDRCQKGHGLWFDEGELRQLLAQLGPAAGPSLRLLDELFTPPTAQHTEQ